MIRGHGHDAVQTLFQQERSFEPGAEGPHLRHCGLPLAALRSVNDIIPAFLGLYRIRPGLYDVERACEDLRWWPPIATRIAELEAEAGTKRSQNSPRKPERKN